MPPLESPCTSFSLGLRRCSFTKIYVSSSFKKAFRDMFLLNYCIRWVLMPCPPLWSMRCDGKLENAINFSVNQQKAQGFISLPTSSSAVGNISENGVSELLSILTNCHPSSQGQCPSPHRCWRFKTMKWTKMIALLLHPPFNLNLGLRCLGSRPARRYLAFSESLPWFPRKSLFFKWFPPLRLPFRLCYSE